MKSFVCICLALVSFSCGSLKESKLTTEALETIAQENLYGNGAEGFHEQQILITSESEWENIKSKLDSVNPTSDNFKNLPVDFEKEMLVLLVSAVKSYGGHSIGIRSLIETEKIIQVIYYETSPNGMATTVLTQPFYLAKLPKRDKKMTFTKEK